MNWWNDKMILQADNCKELYDDLSEEMLAVAKTSCQIQVKLLLGDSEPLLSQIIFRCYSLQWFIHHIRLRECIKWSTAGIETGRHSWWVIAGNLIGRVIMNLYMQQEGDVKFIPRQKWFRCFQSISVMYRGSGRKYCISMGKNDWYSLIEFSNLACYYRIEWRRIWGLRRAGSAKAGF